MLQRIVVLASLFSLLLVIAYPLAFATYTPETYPDSISDPPRCNLTTSGFLCDPNGILGKYNKTHQGVDVVNQRLVEIRSSTNCSCTSSDTNLGQCLPIKQGFTVSVALLDKMELTENESSSVQERTRAASKFAEGLRTRLVRGQCDDDALILISKTDRAVWTSVGAVTRRYLGDQLINAITLRAEQDFEKGDYTAGLLYMVDAYQQVLQGKEVTIKDSKPWYSPLPLWAVWVIGGVAIALILLVLITIFGCLFRCCTKGRRDQYSMGQRTDHL